MSNNEIISNLVEEMPDEMLNKVVEFIILLKTNNDRDIDDLAAASTSSMDFWDNADDEVWDEV